MTTPSLAETLESVAQKLAENPPRDAQGNKAELAALLPAQPVMGDMAIACWVAEDGGEQFDLIRLPSGKKLRHAASMRETLTLLAMNETAEELASFEELPEIMANLEPWQHEERIDTQLRERIISGYEKLEALAALAPPQDEVRYATTKVLDQISAALRELDTAWGLLESSAERWSDAHLEAGGDQELVQELWRAMSGARRGPLRTPVANAINAGREAGIAMATAIREAQKA